jgi:hypothetical protein
MSNKIIIELTDETYQRIVTTACGPSGIKYWCKSLRRDQSQETRYEVEIHPALADDPSGDGDAVVRGDLIPAEMARAIGEMLLSGGSIERAAAAAAIGGVPDAVQSDLLVQWALFGKIVFV